MLTNRYKPGKQPKLDIRRELISPFDKRWEGGNITQSLCSINKWEITKFSCFEFAFVRIKELHYVFFILIMNGCLPKHFVVWLLGLESFLPEFVK